MGKADGRTAWAPKRKQQETQQEAEKKGRPNKPKRGTLKLTESHPKTSLSGTERNVWRPAPNKGNECSKWPTSNKNYQMHEKAEHDP